VSAYIAFCGLLDFFLYGPYFFRPFLQGVAQNAKSAPEARWCEYGTKSGTFCATAQASIITVTACRMLRQSICRKLCEVD